MNLDTDKGNHAREGTDEKTILESPRSSNFKGEATRSTIIPETHEARTLVLCFDGTGDKFDSDNTNVVEFFGMLKKDDHQKQMVYYQAGIGTYISRKALPMGTKVSQILDEAVAWDLSSHIIGGYEYLMEHYQTGDSICIFGFSRGAYTAGGLATMICKVGLLPKSNSQQVRFAYDTFISDNKGQSQEFKNTFSINVKIRFIGVWDTVDSVGLIPQRVPFNTPCGTIHTFRHALALDERRVKFKDTPWKIEESDEHFDEKTDAEQVWFAGCHCDVGGGSVENGKPHSLARIPLRWMIRECFKTKTGIRFESDKLQAAGIDPCNLRHGEDQKYTSPPRLTGYNQCIERNPSTGERWKGRMEKKKEAKREEKKRKAEDKQRKGEKKNHAKGDGTHGWTTDTEIKDEHDSFKNDIGLPDHQVGAQSPDPKTEEENELLDALSPIYDQLVLCPFWWLLEVFPVKRHKQKNKRFGTDIFRYRCNLGEGRYIPPQKKVNVHRSVRTRWEARYANGREYKPKAPLNKCNIIWVD